MFTKIGQQMMPVFIALNVAFVTTAKGYNLMQQTNIANGMDRFETYAAALNLAQNIGRKVSHCQHCHPKWEL